MKRFLIWDMVSGNVVAVIATNNGKNALRLFRNRLRSTGFDTVIARNKQFETVVTCFTYYNCNNELGRYPAFYMERG